MTDTDVLPSSPSAQPAQVMPDPRPQFTRAVAVGRSIVAGLTPEQLHRPTPCSEFDVRELTGHILAVLNRIGVLGSGGSFASTPQSIDDVDHAGWLDAYDEYASRITAAWSDDAVLSTMFDLPWAQLPGAVAMMIYINEVSVHTWDLATATGQAPAWDAGVLEMAYATIQRGLPAEGRTDPGAEVPFAEVVPVADDAPLIDRLVAWNGRRP